MKHRCKPFQNITLNEKFFQYSSGKHCKGGDYQCQNFHKAIFWTSWLHKNISITLQYSGDILRIFLKQKFVECSLNILEKLLCDYWNSPKDQHFLSSNDTLLTQKLLFNWEYFKKYFPGTYSLNVPWMPRTLQHWGSTQQILSKYCVPTGSFPRENHSESLTFIKLSAISTGGNHNLIEYDKDLFPFGG